MLNVGLNPTSNPDNLPAAGGPFAVTFQASTEQGESELRAAYSLTPGVPYKLAGSTALGPKAVSELPASFTMNLTLEHTGAGAAPVVFVNIDVDEVGPGGQPIGQTIQRTCSITLGPAAASFGVGTPATASAATLGARLKAFRAANGMSHKDVADQIGVSAHLISQIEHGTVPSGDVRQKLEILMGA